VDHKPELGLPADARDSDLGAKSYYSTPNMLAVVTKGGLAHELGFRAGDRLVSVNGQVASSIWDLKLVMRANMGKKIRVIFEREGKREDREIKIPAQLR
jgi:predicted metalloprotease with PDZ domain